MKKIKVLTGQDEIGLDLIKTVEKARERCSQPELLLDYIITEMTG